MHNCPFIDAETIFCFHSWIIILSFGVHSSFNVRIINALPIPFRMFVWTYTYGTNKGSHGKAFDITWTVTLHQGMNVDDFCDPSWFGVMSLGTSHLEISHAGNITCDHEMNCFPFLLLWPLISSSFHTCTCRFEEGFETIVC